MKVLLDIKDEKAEFVLELLADLKYVKAKPLTSEKAEIMEGIKEAVEEVKLHKEGKVQLKPIKDLLDEL